MPSRSKKTMAYVYTARPGTVDSLHNALNLGGRTHFAVDLRRRVETGRECTSECLDRIRVGTLKLVLLQPNQVKVSAIPDKTVERRLPSDRGASSHSRRRALEVVSTSLDR